MKFIDLFAGAGGFSLGFEMAGGECLLMIEQDEWAFNTYKQNRVGFDGLMLNGDIKSYCLKDIDKKIAAKPDVIIGGPPCQGFSNASGQKNIIDSRNELFMEFFKWVDYFKPKIFVIENVLGLVSKKDKSGNLYKQKIIEKFSSIGYNVNFWTLNALEYGVPQQRLRVFFVGIKSLANIIPEPQKTHSFLTKDLFSPVSVEEAISDLPCIKAGEGDEEMDYLNAPVTQYQEWSRLSSNKIYNHVAMKHTLRLVNRYKLIQEGNTLKDIPDDFKVRKRGDVTTLSAVQFELNYRLLHPQKVSLTIPASFYSSFIHPFQPRNITAREAARLQSFPDRYAFYGKRTLVSNSLLKKLGKKTNLSQYNQIGNAVPPLLARAIAERIKDYL